MAAGIHDAPNPDRKFEVIMREGPFFSDESIETDMIKEQLEVINCSPECEGYSFVVVSVKEIK